MLKALLANEKSVVIIDWIELFHNETEHFTLSNAMEYLEIEMLNISLINNYFRFCFACPNASLIC
jgi:hypothetical protein